MANKKKDSLDKKKPYNLSISASIIVLFEQRLIDLGLDRNTVAEELLVSFCTEEGSGLTDVLHKVGINNRKIK